MFSCEVLDFFKKKSKKENKMSLASLSLGSSRIFSVYFPIVVVIIVTVLLSVQTFAQEEEELVEDSLELRAGAGRRPNRCVTDGTRKLTGECKFMDDCKPVISNLKAGVKPKLCSNNRINGKVYVCCPTQQRISAKKCNDVQQVRHQIIRPQPLLPVEFVEDTEPSGGDESGEVKCEVNATPFIAEGRAAKLHEFPYMVAVGYGDLQHKKWSCGGSLISDEFVVTAAHCIDTSHGRPRRVLIGDIYLQNPSNGSRKALAAVSQIFVHPNFRKPLKYDDIALLKLAKKVKFNKSILPICLPQPEERLDLVDKNLHIAGWGTIGAFGEQANVLQTATVDRYSQKSCNEHFMNKTDKDIYYPQGIIRSQMCASDKKHDTCRGDSGGPIIVKKIAERNGKCSDFLVGVTSFGSIYCGFREPGVYTNVQSYLDWIEDIVWPGQQ